MLLIVHGFVTLRMFMIINKLLKLNDEHLDLVMFINKC